MLLRLQRSERRRLLSGRTYILTVEVECDPDDRRIIAGHAFSGSRAYTAPVALDLADRAEAAYQRHRNLSVWKQEDTAKIVWQNFKSITLLIRSRLAFHVTVDHLLAGTVIACRDMPELLEAEAAIIKAFDNLKRLVDHARSFQNGRELILAPEDDEDDALAPPATWPRYSRR